MSRRDDTACNVYRGSDHTDLLSSGRSGAHSKRFLAGVLGQQVVHSQFVCFMSPDAVSHVGSIKLVSICRVTGGVPDQFSCRANYVLGQIRSTQSYDSKV